MKYVILILIILSQSSLYSQTSNSYSTEEISSYFNLAKKLSDLDNGKLWGKTLYGPIMLVNPETKKIYTNFPDKNNKLKLISKEIYSGKLSDDELFANTATNWNGVYWTQVMLSSLGVNDLDNGSLLMHECWHRIQDSIGFHGSSSNNNHLEELNGRIYLQLEWEALLNALKNKEKRKFHIENALIFRNYRRSLFVGSDQTENKFEMHEGLAEYTGFTLSTMPLDTIIDRLEKRINKVRPSRKYSNAYAYIHGIAYGALLKTLSPNWNKKINQNSDFGEELRKAVQIKLPRITEKLAKEIMKFYNGDEITKTENEYESEIQQKKKLYENTFITGKTLTLPCETIGINFNPNTVVNLNDYGKVYETITVKSGWGILKATKGALVWKDWKKVIVSAPIKIAESGIEGDEWKIELKPGWKVENLSEKDGSFILVKQ